MADRKESSKSGTRAVALGYDQTTMNAPRVMATGRGYIAEKILQIARENNIPVERDPLLADALSQLDLGQEIPPDLYKVVAEILVFIMETDRSGGKTAR
ncbi:MAG: flagellar biosynthesis [Firmicutes bacterium HGW-Firmicutes-14]|jgi:flagellar biosynthesis protein|nr:MAG: flagellar biosynthesis [Firmicutes bacterium HGW-Firmicutes-14]